MRERYAIKGEELINDARTCAAQSLLDSSESCNGSEYCEPYSGIATSTTMTVMDIETLERDNDSILVERELLTTHRV